MDTQKLIELRQNLVSLEISNSRLQNNLKNQKRDVTIGYVALVIAILLTLASIDIGVILLVGIIIYLVIAVKKKKTLSKLCSDSEEQIIHIRNKLIIIEHS